MLRIDGNSLTLEEAISVIFDKEEVALSPEARIQIQRSRDVILEALKKGNPIYGINTGFGRLSDVRIPDDHLDELQENLVLSHACGVGPHLPDEEVRAILLLKANTLAKGYSGVRVELVELLISMLNKGVLPLIPEKGSVGASGDLAPLAHLALVVLGRGEARLQGERMAGKEALQRAGLLPLTLRAKEGLAILNGTHFMTGVGVVNWHRADILSKTADVVGALTAEAVLGTPVAFDERIQSVRGYAAQQESAARLRRMMQNSPIRESHLNCSRVQDPYSIRCMPQVHGSVQEYLKIVADILSVELNAATDNPLIFPEEGEVLSGGNFHGQPVATAMDVLALVMAQLANISERRIALMMDSSLSDLPPFLVKESGLNSGFMIAQVTAAGLASENKVLSHPASVDSIPTSANKEDFVSMGAQAATKARRVIENAATVLGIELLCACQSLDLRKPLEPGPAGKRILEFVREHVPFMERDRELHADMMHAAEWIISGQLIRLVEDLIE